MNRLTGVRPCHGGSGRPAGRAVNGVKCQKSGAPQGPSPSLTRPDQVGNQVQGDKTWSQIQRSRSEIQLGRSVCASMLTAHYWRPVDKRFPLASPSLCLSLSVSLSLSLSLSLPLSLSIFYLSLFCLSHSLSHARILPHFLNSFSKP